MFLEDLQTREPRPFVYGLSYDVEKGITFKIHPIVVEYLKKIPIHNLISDNLRNFGPVPFGADIQRNFGFNNCSVSEVVDGLIHLSFPVVTKFTPSLKNCTFCSGSKLSFNMEPCYPCKGTGKEFLERDNTDVICASLYILTLYLNWFCVQNDENPFPKNEFGIQNIFVQLDPRAGIGGEISISLMEKVGLFSESEPQIQSIVKNMFDLYLRLEGKDQFPQFEFHTREYQFRCEPRKTGFYLEVPGQNGCSVHMVRDREFACHNVDRNQQHLCLLAGLASLTNIA